MYGRRAVSRRTRSTVAAVMQREARLSSKVTPEVCAKVLVSSRISWATSKMCSVATFSLSRKPDRLVSKKRKVDSIDSRTILSASELLNGGREVRLSKWRICSNTAWTLLALLGLTAQDAASRNASSSIRLANWSARGCQGRPKARERTWASRHCAAMVEILETTEKLPASRSRALFSNQRFKPIRASCLACEEVIVPCRTS